jgi:hypothetical protein
MEGGLRPALFIVTREVKVDMRGAAIVEYSPLARRKINVARRLRSPPTATYTPMQPLPPASSAHCKWVLLWLDACRRFKELNHAESAFREGVEDAVQAQCPSVKSESAPHPAFGHPLPAPRGEGQHARALRFVALLPACGEREVCDEIRICDDHRSLRRARSTIACRSGRRPCARRRSISSMVGGPERSCSTVSSIEIASPLRLRRLAAARAFSFR